MELSTADPVPTSVEFYLAALLSNSAGREICRCFFFLPPTNRCIKLSRAERQTDGRVRCTKRKMFCPGPSCAFGRDVFSAKCLNKVVVLLFFSLSVFWQNSPSSLFSLNLLKPFWGRRENFSVLWRFAVQLERKNPNYKTCCQCPVIIF